MRISIDLPDEVGQLLHSRWQDLPRHALEALATDAYRQGVLTAAELQESLGLRSRFEVDALLKRAGAHLDYTWHDLDEDLRDYRQAAAPR